MRLNRYEQHALDEQYSARMDSEAERRRRCETVPAIASVPRELDIAWTEINALGGVNHSGSAYEQGYISAIDDALRIIERLGGEDTVTGGEDFVRYLR